VEQVYYGSCCWLLVLRKQHRLQGYLAEPGNGRSHSHSGWCQVRGSRCLTLEVHAQERHPATEHLTFSGEECDEFEGDGSSP